MKVKALIEQLKKFDPELDVFGYCENEDISPDSCDFRAFGILSASLGKAEIVSLDDGTLHLKFGGSDTKPIVTLEMAID